MNEVKVQMYGNMCANCVCFTCSDPPYETHIMTELSEMALMLHNVRGLGCIVGVNLLSVFMLLHVFSQYLYPLSPAGLRGAAGDLQALPYHHH